MTKAEQLIVKEARNRELKNGDRPKSEITKREYFAGLAMQGILSDPNRGSELDHNLVIVEHAVKFADLLLAELEKTKNL
jgi:hypothetical protein